jgi:MFS family permease
MDLVIVNESVGSGNMTDAFKTETKPVLLLEAFIAEDMDVASPGTIADQTKAEILLPDHLLAAGLSALVDIYKAPKILSTWTGLVPAAIKVGTQTGNPDVAAIFAYTVSNGLSGPLLDRFGTRIGYAGCMAWWSTAGIVHDLVTGPWSLAGCRFLLGIGEAGNWPAAVKVVTEWFPVRERALAAGTFNPTSRIHIRSIVAIFGNTLAPN